MDDLGIDLTTALFCECAFVLNTAIAWKLLIVNAILGIFLLNLFHICLSVCISDGYLRTTSVICF